MEFVPRKTLAQWYSEAYGGEENFHADILASRGETVLDILIAVMRSNVYLNTPLALGATIHFKISVKE